MGLVRDVGLVRWMLALWIGFYFVDWILFYSTSD